MGIDLTAAVAPAVTVTHWQTTTATVVGSSHERDGTPGQDVVGIVAVDDDRAVVVAVADGAGSAADGGKGAAVAVAAALDAAVSATTTGAPPVDAANLALDAARVAVEAQADTGETPLADLASTLAVAVVTSDEVGAAVVGDSAIVVCAAGDYIVVTGDSGEYINETTFLTSADWERARRAETVFGPVDGVAAFSDGLALLALDVASGTAHAPFFAPLFEFAGAAGDDRNVQLASFLASPRVRDRTDDDVTLALIVGRPDATR